MAVLHRGTDGEIGLEGPGDFLGEELLQAPPIDTTNHIAHHIALAETLDCSLLTAGLRLSRAPATQMPNRSDLTNKNERLKCRSGALSEMIVMTPDLVICVRGGSAWLGLDPL